ncbi:MAG TPA: alpha/beta hydrolase [Candidatus Choladousia intestinigallinarum]|nr:alpha/beta hydrolase [Candidatus Choladousia intestinigallinarum]
MKPKLAFPIPTTPEFDPGELPENITKHLDLQYGCDSREQVLDLYLPREGTGKSPLILYIHEGAFAFGSKRDKRAETLFKALERGYAIASIDYRKSGEATWPAPLYDIKTAVRFLRAHADTYSLDENRFAAWGMSAGAYYGSLAAVTHGIPGFEDPRTGYGAFSSGLQAVVDLCGACSGFHLLDEMIRENGGTNPTHDRENSPESILMGNPLQEIRELCRLAAPITYVNGKVPPFFIFHCVSDPVVPVQQSENFAAALKKAAGEEKVKLVLGQGQGDHGKPDYNTREIVREALDFLDQVFSLHEETEALPA